MKFIYKTCIAISLIALTFPLKILSQVSEGGTPISFLTDGIKETIKRVVVTPVNTDSLVGVFDEEYLESKPYKFGFPITVDISISEHGTWDTLSNGSRMWRVEIESENAYSINLIFNKFYLPEGSSMFIYNKTKEYVLGRFTPAVSNNQFNVFSTDLVPGEIITIEYFEPPSATGVEIEVGKVVHGFRDFFDSGGLGTSQGCNVDINCPEGDPWCIQRRAVSMILLDENSAICTGCLLNNEREDLIPYYLTAMHCADKDKDGVLSQDEMDDIRSWIFRFKYWRPECSSSENPNHWVSISGAVTRASHNPTDMLLLELNNRPPIWTWSSLRWME